MPFFNSWNKVKKTVSILLVSFFFSSFSHAQELTILETETAQELLLFYEEDELLSASFFPTVTTKAPGYSYIITEDQTEKSPARTLDDIIKMRVPGMTTGGHERHGPLIGTRGIFIDNNAKTMVMLDEQQINQRAHFGYTTGLLSPLLGDIKRVEVILGPGAIIHGSGALNGFINLIPKNGRDNSGWFANSEYGFKEELWKVETGYGTSYGTDKNIYLYGGAYGAEGFEPDELYGGTKTFDIHAKGFDGGNYRFSLYWNHEDFNLNAFYYENNPYKNSSVEIDAFHQATLGIRPKYVYDISETDSFEVAGSLLWFDHRSPRNIPPDFVIEDRGGAENHLTVKNIFRTTRWDRHSLAGGFSFGEKKFYQRKQFFSDDNAETWLGILDTDWQELGIFVEDIFAITPAWTVSFGLRYDKLYLNDMMSELWEDEKTPEDIEGHYSPRIATAYEIDENTTVKASYQHGFRTPDAFYYVLNLRYKDEAEAIGLEFPDLDIETMDSFEVNLQKEFLKRKLKFDLNLFYNIFEDQLRFRFYEDIGLLTPAQRNAIKTRLGLPSMVRLGSFLNAGEDIEAYGGEIICTFRPLTNTEISLNYGYVQLDNADVMQYPSHQVKFQTLSYFWDDKLSLGLNYLYNSSYSESDLPLANDIYREDRHVVDLALHYNLSPKAHIGLIVNNLFEHDTPPMVFDPDRLERGGLGFGERLVYLSFGLEF